MMMMNEDWQVRFHQQAEENAKLRRELSITRQKYDDLLEASLQQMAMRLDEFSSTADRFKRLSPSSSSSPLSSSPALSPSSFSPPTPSSFPPSLQPLTLSTSTSSTNLHSLSPTSPHPLSVSIDSAGPLVTSLSDKKNSTPKKKTTFLGSVLPKRKDKKEKDTTKGSYPVDEDTRTDFVLPSAPGTSYQHLPRLLVCPLVSRNQVIIAGPSGPVGPVIGDESGCAHYTDVVAGRSISTYPHIPGNPSRDGDPIADRFSAHVFENRVIAAVADGCNWGVKPREAAQKANTAFLEYVGNCHDSITDVKKAGAVLLNAFEYAHNSIMEGKLAFWDAGTTTLLGGVLLEINKGNDKWTPQWEFVCASVGDCKAFCYSNGEITDITQGNRKNASDPRDPGGRLGPHLDEGKPDLRNLNLFCAPCEDGDIIIIVTDGIHDNLDPQHLGKLPKDMPKEFNLTGEKWDDVDPAKAIYAKNAYITELLLKLIKTGEETPTPKEVADRLVNHCVEVTKKSREYMEVNQGKRLPEDYVEFPGKMDHTTCLCFRVGRFPTLPERITIVPSAEPVTVGASASPRSI